MAATDKKISFATLADIDALVDIRVKAESLRDLRVTQRDEAATQQRQLMRAQIQENAQSIYVVHDAALDDSIQGYLVHRPGQKTTTQIITSLYTLPTHDGSGSALLERFIEDMRHMGKKSIQVTPATLEPAAAWYYKKGFRWTRNGIDMSRSI